MTYTEEEYNDMLREKAAELQALHLDHAAQIEALNQAHAEALATALAAANTSPASPPLLASLDDAFESLVPQQLHTAFESAWVIVRNLVQAGKLSRAAAFVRALDVPDEMISTRTQIADMIAGGN